jgi:hypothetical protein
MVKSLHVPREEKEPPLNRAEGILLAFLALRAQQTSVGEIGNALAPLSIATSSSFGVL